MDITTQSVELKQFPIKPEDIPKLAEIRINIFHNSADALTTRMYTGDLTIGAWEESMKALLKEMHSSMAAIGKGGWDNMTFSDWGRVGAEVKKQYRYLHNFAEDVTTNKETMPLGSMMSRARMYGDSAGYTTNLMAVPSSIRDKLPWMPKDGSTDCMTKCKCEWLLEVVSKTRQTQLVDAIWTLNPAEHCDTCLDRDGYSITIEIPATESVPVSIGGF